MGAGVVAIVVISVGLLRRDCERLPAYGLAPQNPRGCRRRTARLLLIRLDRLNAKLGLPNLLVEQRPVLLQGELPGLQFGKHRLRMRLYIRSCNELPIDVQPALSGEDARMLFPKFVGVNRKPSAGSE